MNGLNSIPSPVDEAIKVPMLTDAFRLLASLLFLQSPTRQADGGGAFGTNYFEVISAPEESSAFSAVHRLTHLFERHTPASVRREAGEASGGAYSVRNLDASALPGPRWKGSSFTAFLQSAGLLARSGDVPATPTRPLLARHDIDLDMLSVCGKGGTMDVLDFCEVCVKVARRLWPERRDEPPAALLDAMVDGPFQSLA
mmetsp:Transcript_24301/g.55314  ORF Transcript_24301/g.55314 Transcript_24301/m.55314 type:complete len:199 (-) Transcript_24301:141-737(-)